MPITPCAVSEGAIELVRGVSHKLNTIDRDKLLAGVCAELAGRWDDEYLEQRLNQMGLQTTDKILYVIDVYRAGRAYGYLH